MANILYDNSSQDIDMELGKNDEYENICTPNNKCTLKPIQIGIAISILLPISTTSASLQQNSKFKISNKNSTEKIEQVISREEKDTVDFHRIMFCMQIQGLGILDENWDGYGAIKVMPICISNAQNIINYKDIFCNQIQDIYANPNGTISILFENDNDESIGLEIGKESMSYYVAKKDGNTFVKDASFNEKNYIKLSSYIAQL